MEPIREILKVKVDPECNPTHITRTVRGDLFSFPPDTVIFHPEGMMAIEDFKAGESIRWAFAHAEFQYVLKGQAKLTYSLSPWHDEQKTLSVVPGDAYLIPNGADVTFSVAPGDPLRRMCVVMPSYMQYVEIPPKKVIPIK